ncbi:hypothetical protein ABZP36_005968 [Zizania latifolia]
MAPVADDLARGAFSFVPQDGVLSDSFLLPKITGQLKQPSFMHDVDVYYLPPEDLAAKREPAPSRSDAKVWYFFSPLHNCHAGGSAKRKARTVGGTDGKKWWHSESSKKPVKGGAAGGYFQKFSYKEKTASGVVKPGWLMVEYGVSKEHGSDADLVLCKIYRSPRATRSGSSSSSCTSPSSATAMTPLSQSDPGSSKRKAAEEHPEAPPPTVQRTSGDEDIFFLAEDAADLIDVFNGELDDNATSMQVMQHGAHTPPCAHGTEELEGDELSALPFLGEDCGELSDILMTNTQRRDVQLLPQG